MLAAASSKGTVRNRYLSRTLSTHFPGLSIITYATCIIVILFLPIIILEVQSLDWLIEDALVTCCLPRHCVTYLLGCQTRTLYLLKIDVAHISNVFDFFNRSFDYTCSRTNGVPRSIWETCFGFEFGEPLATSAEGMTHS